MKKRQIFKFNPNSKRRNYRFRNWLRKTM